MFVPWRPCDPFSYAYLLDLYPGDGHVATYTYTANLTRIHSDGCRVAPAEFDRFDFGVP
jgi:hypothetical protein